MISNKQMKNKNEGTGNIFVKCQVERERERRADTICENTKLMGIWVLPLYEPYLYQLYNHRKIL
jgi:hypothetical protein